MWLVEMLNKSATVSSVTNLDRGLITEDLWIIFDSPIAEYFDWISGIIISGIIVNASAGNRRTIAFERPTDAMHPL